MKAIEIDDDLYEFLRQQQTTFSGESASEILGRLLKPNSAAPSIPHDTSPKQALPPDAWKRWGLQQTQDEILRDERKMALWEFLKGPEFKAERNAVGKFLVLLAFLHRANRDKFAGVQGISGRSRKYFAKSESDLEQSGTSVHPKRIPGSEYWVVTNNSTQSKCQLLVQVLKLLGYDGWFAAFVATHVT
jgi:negative modulator of initiation of replication